MYKDNTFIGVIGIEIDYNTIVAPVNYISLYDNGYAFISDTDGNIIYHPRMDISEFTGENKPTVPEKLKTGETYIRYSYNGVDKQAVSLPLHNGMRLIVTVPVSEINVTWYNLLKEINDEFGHIKGDMYLKSSVSIICHAFSHSPVFRIGGDEFAVILKNEAYKNRKRLTRIFEERLSKTASAKERWQQISIAFGIAVYDAKIDESVYDVIKRADILMYENKRLQKENM